MKIKKLIKKRNLLDEMQEQKLLRIEHNGCWLAFWGLFAVIVVQALFYGQEGWDNYIGEWIVFMCLAIYMLFESIRNGIWDRKYAPTPANNLIYSIVLGIFCGIFQFVASYSEYQKLLGSIAAGIFTGLSMFSVGFVSFIFLTFIYRKRVDKLESEKEEDNKIE